MPVLTMEREATRATEPLLRFVTNLAMRVKLPAWSAVALVAIALAAGFLAGRRHPAHHYVKYFGYPMVMDTTTGKACYAVPPKPAGAVQDTAYPIDGTANPVDEQPESGPSIPLCGQE
jgi:hypothetical protein